jgi:hypothetical protein
VNRNVGIKIVFCIIYLVLVINLIYTFFASDINIDNDSIIFEHLFREKRILLSNLEIIDICIPVKGPQFIIFTNFGNYHLRFTSKNNKGIEQAILNCKSTNISIKELHEKIKKLEKYSLYPC